MVRCAFPAVLPDLRPPAVGRLLHQTGDVSTDEGTDEGTDVSS